MLVSKAAYVRGPVYSSTSVSRNYSKVAYLKQSKSTIVHLFFFLSSSASLVPAGTQEVTQIKQPQIKQPSIMGIFPKNGLFVLSLK